jgi:pyruvate dehydrogenase kinase 2/3/4
VRSLSRVSKRWEPGALAEKLAQRPQVSVSMQSLLDTAMGLNRHRVPGARKDTSMPVEMQVARFLHRELPVRFAHRIVELKNLPHGLANEESVVTVREWYEQSAR